MTKNGWTPERRAKQAEWMRKMKPWDKSTGSRTAEGKAIVKNNALKHGHRSAEYREMCAIMKAHLKWLESLKRPESD